MLSGGGALADYQAGVVKALAELDVGVHAVAEPAPAPERHHSAEPVAIS